LLAGLVGAGAAGARRWPELETDAVATGGGAAEAALDSAPIL
jgi:hypothetical protein